MRLGDLLKNPEGEPSGVITERHIRSFGRFLRSFIPQGEQPRFAEVVSEWLWSQQDERDEGYPRDEIRDYLLTGRGLTSRSLRNPGEDTANVELRTIIHEARAFRHAVPPVGIPVVFDGYSDWGDYGWFYGTIRARHIGKDSGFVTRPEDLGEHVMKETYIFFPNKADAIASLEDALKTGEIH